MVKRSATKTIGMARSGSLAAWTQSWAMPPSTGSSCPVVYVASNARKRTALAISSDVPQELHRAHPDHLLPNLGGHAFTGIRFAENRRVDGTGRHRVDANPRGEGVDFRQRPRVARNHEGA